MQRRWLKFVGVVGLTLLVSGLLTAGFKLYGLLYQPMMVSKNKPAIICVDRYTSASSFVHLLKSRHFIRSNDLLYFIRFQGLAQQLKAGIYDIKEGESPAHFLYRVTEGDVLIETFRIIEGTTEAQVAANLQKAPHLCYNAADWLTVAGSFPRAEGLLLADTYHYDAGSQSKPLLERAHANLQTFLQASWQGRSPDLPYKNAYEMLIAASILEKEAAIPSEKRLIAGVIINRLKKKMPLQMDPTVIYGLGADYTGTLTHENLNLDSPYNTYRYRGLPPTPIAMVGKEAIDAAAHPAVTPYLYFVARGDGSHYFSETYDEQRQAIARYLKK